MEKIRLIWLKSWKVVVPVVIFTLLFVVGTCWDLEISKFLARGLKPHEYYTSNVVARFVEVFGSLPIWIAVYLSVLVFYKKAAFHKEKYGYLAIVFWVISFGVLLVCAMKTCEPLLSYTNATNKKYSGEMIVLYFIFASFGATLGHILISKLDEDLIDRLIPVSCAALCSCIIGYSAIKVIKGPAGRIRYRAMNQIDDFSYYMPWYYFGNKTGLRPEIFSAGKDAFKSFPSGHSFSGSMIFILSYIPYVIDKYNTKSHKICIHLFSICYTVFVALFRIVAGAHFLTDVIIGAGIGFLVVQFFKYVFLVRKVKVIKFN